jgi:ureidoacrylate peracid hydrolase
VDLQNDFVHERGAQHLMGHNKALTPEQRSILLRRNQQLIAEMRRLDQPVIHVVTLQRRDLLDSASPPVALRRRPVPDTISFLLEGSWGAEIVEELTPQADDFVLRKAGRSAFGFTPLHRLLRNLEVSECLVTGGGINGCVEDTVREGNGLGYDFTVVIDATYEPGAPFAHLLADQAAITTTEEILGRLGSPLS